MRPNLYLIREGPSEHDAGTAEAVSPPYDLLVHPQRPGELCDDITLDAPAQIALDAAASSAAVGLPPRLWVTLRVEGRRALDALISFGLEEAETSASLDAIASADSWASAPIVATSRLRSYAAALRTAKPVQELPRLGTLQARLPLRLRVGWDAAAAAAATPVSEWAVGALGRGVGDVVRWEASAAERGQSIGEWAMVQALRCRRTSSTCAQVRE